MNILLYCLKPTPDHGVGRLFPVFSHYIFYRKYLHWMKTITILFYFFTKKLLFTSSEKKNSGKIRGIVLLV